MNPACDVLNDWVPGQPYKQRNSAAPVLVQDVLVVILYGDIKRLQRNMQARACNLAKMAGIITLRLFAISAFVASMHPGPVYPLCFEPDAFHKRQTRHTVYYVENSMLEHWSTTAEALSQAPRH